MLNGLMGRKWYMRLMCHLIEMTLVNALQKVQSENGHAVKVKIQAKFHSEVAFQFYQLGSICTNISRLSNLESEIAGKGPTKHVAHFKLTIGQLLKFPTLNANIPTVWDSHVLSAKHLELCCA